MHLVAVTYAPTEKRLHWLGFWMASGLGFALWCSAVPPGAVTHVMEHHASERANVARQTGPVGVPCAPVWCTGCMCLPTAPRAISGRASGVQALEVSHPDTRYPGWCTVVQRCQSGLARQGHPLPVLKHGPRSLSEAASNAVRVVKAGTEQLVAGSAVPPLWPGLASATRPVRGMQQWPQLPILPTVAWLKRTDHFCLRCYCVLPRLWGL